jgi:predicted  nucleic acid-binding Zn-ribbon protein
MSVAIQYFLNTNRVKLDDWYSNQYTNTTTFGLWRNRTVVLLKESDSWITKIFWKISLFFGFIDQSSHPVEIIKEFYIQYKSHQELTRVNKDLSDRINELTDEMLDKRKELSTLNEEQALLAQSCSLLKENHSTLSNEVNAATHALEKMSADLDKKSRILKDLNNHTATAQEIITKGDFMQSQLSNLEKSIKSAERKNKTLTALIKRLEDLKGNIPGVKLSPAIVLELNTQRTQIEQGLIRLIEKGAWIKLDENSLSDVLNEAQAYFKQYQFNDITWLENLQLKAALLKDAKLSTTNESLDISNINTEFKALAETFYTYSNTLQSLAHTGHHLVL